MKPKPFPFKEVTGKYMGLTFNKVHKKWTAQITIPNKGQLNLGLFKTEVEAAEAYNTAAEIFSKKHSNLIKQEDSNATGQNNNQAV